MAYGEDKRASKRPALPPWPRRLRAFFTAKLLETADRFFDHLPLQADRYGRGFLLALGGVLGFIGLSYWTVSAYWNVDWFAREDGALEWASVSMFLTSAALAAAAARSLARLGHPRLGSFHLLLAIALLLISMEEISWGQRLFGWSTPAVLTGANQQNETNLHNIEVFELVLYSGLLYGSLMALAGALARAVLHHHRRVTTADFILPSLLLSPLLLMVFIWTGEGKVFETLKSYFVSRPVGSEFPEVLLAFGLLVYTWANFRRARGLWAHDRGPTSDGEA